MAQNTGIEARDKTMITKFCECGKIVSGVNEKQLKYNTQQHNKSKNHKHAMKLKKSIKAEK